MGDSTRRHFYNPFANVRLTETTFASHPQLVLRERGMVWTDKLAE